MPKKTKRHATWDPKRFWRCEDCGTVHEDLVDPPDDCTHCGYKFFENMADRQAEADKKAASRPKTTS
jgi:rubrerythrin